MTKPQLERMKFWIVKPATGRNYLYKPTFAEPDGAKWWTVYGPGVTKAITGDEQRFGAYSMQVNPVAGVDSYVTCLVPVTSGSYYTFSCYLKGASGVTINISIRDNALVSKAGKNVTFTGYWQRAEVTWLADATATNYKVDILQSSSSTSNAPFYVDGVQFEPTSVATTLMEGYMPGCRWEGIANDSTIYRTGESGLGGKLLDISDYARILSVHGLGMGDWNQVMTKMTSGGDMYQTHIRKSRNFSMVLAYTGDNQGDMQANRKVIIDALRPDYLFGSEDERRIIRYQGFDSNGDEATNPVDIICVFQPSHTDTPSLPVFQKDTLNFTIPSGLLNGAYNEGAELDLYADFPAEFIVKRDPDGNWCKFNSGTGDYDSLMKYGIYNGVSSGVNCMAEGPDGKIYIGGAFTNAGGVSAADYLARWNPVTETYESIISGINDNVNAMAFDANGDLYIGGRFVNLGSSAGNKIVKITDLYGSPTVVALGTGADTNPVNAIAIDEGGNVYIGGSFNSVSGVANTKYIAKWDGTAWSALSTGLNNFVYALAFAPNGDLYIGGLFTNADGTYGDYLCYKRPDENVFKRVGMSELNGNVYALAFDMQGRLYVGGEFTAIGSSNISYIARWNGSAWESLGMGTNATVRTIVVDSGKVYVAGDFTTAGGLTLTDRVAVFTNGAWQPLDIDLPTSGYVYSILPASDGSLYIGGAFSTFLSSVNAETGIVALNLNVSSASANTYPYIQVYGPGTLKAITNYSTGKTIAFDGLTLNAGEWINLSFDPLNLQFKGGWPGRGNLMRYVIPGSDYGDFYLRPGKNALSLFMTGTDSNSGAWIQWTPLFWGLDGALL